MAGIQLRTLALPKDSASSYDVVGPLSRSQEKILTPLGKVNLFVGENNSGKSRLLRAFASSSKLRFYHSGVEDLENFRLETVARLEKIEQRQNAKYKSIQALRGQAEIDLVEEGADFAKPVGDILDELGSNPKGDVRLGMLPDGAKQEMVEIGREASKHWTDYDFGNKLAFKKIYIPTLRGLRDISGGNDLYWKKTKEDYFDKSDTPEIFTGLSLFQEYRKLLLGAFEKRQWVREFEAFLSEAFFPGRTVTLIPQEGSQVLHVKIGTERERPIQFLGEGIHSIIILTFPLFNNRKTPTLAFFEEPEMSLHPGYQRLFLNVLLSGRFPNQQYFLTTHSNHFLDITADREHVSVFTFRREIKETAESPLEQDARYEIENVSSDDMRPLELLGVRNSSVLLSNCTIWVEGITDRRYLARWLRLYIEAKGKKPYREDLHFSFVEYSGGNITHWSFLDNIDDPIDVNRLCGKLFLIADKDDPKEESKKAERAAKLSKTLAERFFQLPCREIENLLTPAILSGIVNSLEEKTVSFDKVTQGHLENVGLGTFIENLLKKQGIEDHRRYAANREAKQSTIVNKVEFCALALELTKSYADLSPAAQALTEAVYTFIDNSNS